ncbi:MAG: hypothetical protein IKG30_08420 [Clostridiales bacterium]|nr:hypothetical protein [Clostridiales bacterium]
MSMSNKEQQTDQLLRGIYRMCINRDDCRDCPFYVTKCSFGEPKPRTWFDEETIAIQAAPDFEIVSEEESVSVSEPESVAAVEVDESAAAAEHVAPVEQPVESAEQPVEANAEATVEQPAEAPVEPPVPQVDDDSVGTWLVSTTMGSFFTKYVFICSKCGYKKESVFSLTPTSLCPECEKRKAGQS